MTDPTAARPPVERSHPPDALVRVVNPLMRLLLSSPAHRLVSGGLMLLHYRGRRTGRSFTLPVAHHDVDGGLVVLTNSGWRVNFRGGLDAEVTLRGERRAARGELVEDPEVVARVYEDRLAEVGPAGARRLGLTVNVDRMPTRAELLEAARRHHLSLIRLRLR